jgi:pimeloyl-ACP methyl ester carboxylesterase
MSSPYIARRPAESDTRVIRGLRAHLTRWAGDDPQPIVLLHGFMDCGDTFQFLVDALPESRSFVAPDWRGFGRSEWPAQGYWFPDYFGDLDALLDELAPAGPVTLVGHSMGGNIAMMYAGLRPERVRLVVNIEGFGLSPTRPEQAPGQLRQWLDQLRAVPESTVFPSLDVLCDVLRKRNPRLPADRAAFVARAWSEPDTGAAVRMRFDPAHKRVNPVLYRRDEAEACWREVVAPLLYVLGTESTYLARLGGIGQPEAILGIVRGLEPHWIEDAGHMVHHERPAELAAAIEAFLERHRPGKRAS